MQLVGGRRSHRSRRLPPPAVPNKVSYRPSLPLDFQLIVVVDGGMSYLPIQRERRSERHTHNQDTMQGAGWLVATFFGAACHGLAGRGGGCNLWAAAAATAAAACRRLPFQTKSPTGHPSPSIFS